VPSGKEGRQHGFECRSNGGNERSQFCDVLWFVLHDLFPRFFLFNLIQTHRETLSIHPPGCRIISCQPKQIANARHILPGTSKSLAIDLDHIHMQQVIFQIAKRFSSRTIDECCIEALFVVAFAIKADDANLPANILST